MAGSTVDHLVATKAARKAVHWAVRWVVTRAVRWVALMAAKMVVKMAVWREFMCIFNLDADSIGLLLFTRTLTESEINGSVVGVVMTAL